MAASAGGISDSEIALLKRLGIDPENPLAPRPELSGRGDYDLPTEEYVAATFPSEAEVILSLEQWFRANDEDSKELLNGSKPLHLLEFYELVAPIYLPKLPSPGDIVKIIWKLIPAGMRKTIKQWAKNATAEDKAKIAKAITPFVATALKTLGVPPIIIGAILGPLVRKAVDWIVKNVATLPD